MFLKFIETKAGLTFVYFIYVCYMSIINSDIRIRWTNLIKEGINFALSKFLMDETPCSEVKFYPQPVGYTILIERKIVLILRENMKFPR